MTLEDLTKSGSIVVGTPDDAIAQIRRLQAKQGEFGVLPAARAQLGEFREHEEVL